MVDINNDNDKYYHMIIRLVIHIDINYLCDTCIICTCV